MNGKSYILALALLLLGTVALAASRDDGKVYFAASEHSIDMGFRNNAAILNAISLQLSALPGLGVDTVTVHLAPCTSPDGQPEYNGRLASERARSVQAFLTSLRQRPVLVFTQTPRLYTWAEVQGLDLKEFRSCGISLEYTMPDPEDTPEETEVVVQEEVPAAVEVETAPIVPAMPLEPIIKEDPWSPSWYLKTNFLTYPLNLSVNLAFEVEIGRHFSVSIPVYYSAMDWFRNDIKFRVLGSQPEMRYYFDDTFSRWFTGVHFTFGWYNIALKGMYRYQDHSTTSPAFGGGVEGGYRLPLGSGNRWALEFVLGVGYIPFYYDTFYNVPNGALAQEGLMKHYFGPDHAAVSLSYRFGKRRNVK